MHYKPDYSNCWEDSGNLLKALGKQQGGRLISIASAGDNCLSLLSLEPESIDVIDTNPVQLALMHLKIAAARLLSYEDFLKILGFHPCSDRLRLYSGLRHAIPESYRDVLDRSKSSIKKGIIHTGKLERVFRVFRNSLMPLLWKGEFLKSLFLPENGPVPPEIIEKEMNRRLWRILRKGFMSPGVISMLGRDIKKFKYAEGSLSEMLQQQILRVLLQNDVAENPYMHYILFGNFKNQLPHYADRGSYQNIREHSHRFHFHETEMDTFLSQSESYAYTGFNLSDIFEYLSEPQTDRLFNLIVESGVSKARVVYWNMMVSRKSRHPEIQTLFELSSELAQKDRLPFYSRFLVEEVQKS